MMNVKIIRSSSPDYWYADKIGDVYEVVAFGVQYRVRNEPLLIQKEDCEVVKEPFFGLEEAYSGPVAASYDKTYYTRPATKLDAPKKQTVHQLVAETFSALSGKPLSENDVKVIVQLVEVMNKL